MAAVSPAGLIIEAGNLIAAHAGNWQVCAECSMSY